MRSKCRSQTEWNYSGAFYMGGWKGKMYFDVHETIHEETFLLMGCSCHVLLWVPVILWNIKAQNVSCVYTC